jgi:hypothetical protein
MAAKTAAERPRRKAEGPATLPAPVGSVVGVGAELVKPPGPRIGVVEAVDEDVPLELAEKPPEGVALTE